MTQNLFSESHGGKKDMQLRQFEALALPLLDKIYNTALHMTANEFDAEDLAHNTFLKAWSHFDRLETGTNFTGWIFRILTDNFLKDYRKKRSQPSQQGFEIASATYAKETHHRTDGDPIIDTDNPELSDDAVSAALQELPEQHRLSVLLCDVSGLGYMEAAEALNCSSATVLLRLNRGRQMLAKSLERFAFRN